MKTFNSLTENQREEILSNQITTELLVDTVTLGFENIEEELPSVDINNNFEVPPIIIDNKHLAQIMAFSTPDNKGRWIRTMVRTYLEGGKVLYKKIDNDNFIATLFFAK